jgi:hypothetical protein
MKNVKESDVENMVVLTNEYTDKFISLIDPRDYEKDIDSFVHLCLTSPSMISATIIDKISSTFKLDRHEVFDEFIKKLNLAMRWVDHKNEH